MRLSPQGRRFEAVGRRPVLLVALGVLSSWSIGGLFFSLGPQLSAQLFGSTDHLVAGIGVFLLAGAGSVAQLAFGRSVPWVGAAGGSIALSLGMLLVVVAVAAESPFLYVAGSLLGGAGFGVAFLGALRALSVAIPHEHRAAVMSAFYVVAYGALSVPAILAGLLVTPLGLDATFELFGSVVAVLALVVAFEAWRTRPMQYALKTNVG
jgi:hypothetical protein